MFPRRPVCLLLAYLLDRAAGEPPPPAHPVVWLGRCLDLLEGLWPPRGRPADLLPGGLSLGVAAVLGWAAGAGLARLAARMPGLAGIIAEALALKPAFAGRMLWAEALAVADLLAGGDLAGARVRVRSLVSRPTDGLAPAFVASAAVESVAENLTDSVVAPLLAYLVWGLPGAYVYRAVNTADARWGYRGPFEFFGKAAARADDLANLVPARLAAAALILAGALRGENALGGLEVWGRDGARTESPNAGQTMATMAGLLGVRLEKPGHYVLGGEFPYPMAADIRRAVRLGQAAGWVVVAGLTVLGLMVGRRYG